MCAWLRECDRDARVDPLGRLTGLPWEADCPHSGHITGPGAQWLASAGTYPRSLLAHWESSPDTPLALPCGTVFDVVSLPAVLGRQVLERLWGEGPGSGPVAAHRGRTLVFAAPGTASRLPSLLGWEEWGDALPPPLCHGLGDAVTVPPLARREPAGGAGGAGPEPRWLLAPGTRHPWLPGPDVLLWAYVRAARTAGDTGATPAPRVSIFPPADQGATVYDVSRRR
ncbi:bifunctional DNA primase/polymerase [Streptomyces sp. NPDC057638]|uniref:bifunctional DNA primase/polymerase n=1 Tax=Streptomyces sp. NPDC057638 TaxID=3346190 RepID=UPI0036C3116A